MTDRLARWLHGRSLADRLALPPVEAVPRLGWRSVTPLPGDPPGWHAQAWSVLLDGSLGILRTDHDIAALWRTWSAGGGRRDRFALPQRSRCMLTSFDGRVETRPCVTPLAHAFPRFDRLADGGWIIADNVGKPCRPPGHGRHRRPDGSHADSFDRGPPMTCGNAADDGNATLLRPDGSIGSRFELGDDIVHLLADPHGGFWVSYGDTNASAGGIVRHAPDGRRDWVLNDHRGDPCLDPCFHPYALNVGREGAWSYCYANYLLSRLHPDERRCTWRPAFMSASAVAVAATAVMMVAPGGFRTSRHHVARFDLGDPILPHRPRRRWLAAVEAPDDARLFTARDDVLHAVGPAGWHRLSIAAADAQIPVGPWRA